MNYSNHLLGDIATTHRGLAVPRARVSTDNEIPYLHYGDIYKIYDNYFDFEKLKDNVIKINSDEKIKDYQYLHTGDIVINLTSENYEDLGKSIYIKNDDSMLVSGMETIIIRFNSELFDPLFLNYYFDTKYFYNDIMQYVRGMKVFRVNPKDLLRAKLPEIPKNQQIQIASFIKSLDDKIELNNKINKNLEEMAQTLYKQWFVDFEFPNEDGEPYKSSGGEMIESELGLIPKGWEVLSLDELSSNEKYSIVDGPFGTQMKVAEYTSNGVPIIEMKYLKGSEIENKFDNFITEEKYEVVKRSTVRPGDIIISKTGTLGYLGYLPNEVEKAILVSRLAKITPNFEILGTYTMLLIFKYLNKVGHWYRIASGSTMPLLNMGLIKNTKVIFSKDNEISDRFEKLAKAMYVQINNNVRENRKLEKLRDTLLPKLMSGEIEVPIKE